MTLAKRGAQVASRRAWTIRNEKHGNDPFGMRNRDGDFGPTGHGDAETFIHCTGSAGGG